MNEFDIDVEELRDSVRKLLSAESDSHAVRAILEGDDARRSKLWQQMAELGWLALSVDEAYGGLGQGFPQLAVLYEELGRQLTPLPLLPTLLSVQALQTAGSDEQKSRWLESLASGERSATFAFANHTTLRTSEFKAGAPVSGSISAVVDADQVDLIFLPMLNEAGDKALLVVDRGSDSSNPQLNIEWKPSADETRRLCDVSLNNVALDENNVLKLDSEQWAALEQHACLALACDSVGGATRIFEETVDYMKTREQFGRAIGSFQALKHRCASWKILQEAAAALCGQAVNSAGEAADEEQSVWASSAKYYACDAYAAIAGDAIQLHGGIGFTWEHDCHLYFKRAKLNQVLLGDSAAHKDRIAQQIFN